jgi:membrane protein DedA with SNARE-associated domain
MFLTLINLGLSINIVGRISHFLIVVIRQLGYAGIFVGMTMEGIGLLIPCEAVMPFAGYVASEGKLTFIGVALAGALGGLAGSLIAYYIGLWGGRPLLERYGKYVLIRRGELDRAHKWFEKYGDSAVFISRLLPVVRTFISYPAGIVRMDVKKFSLYTFLGQFLFCLALAYIGFLAGPHWPEMERSIVNLGFLAIASIIGLLGYLIYHRARILSYIRAS